MEVAVSAIGALLPSLLLFGYFHRRDVHREPHSVLVKTYFLGVLILVPVLIVALPLQLLISLPANPLVQGLFIAFCCAAIPEEFFKFLVVRGYSARHTAFDEPMDGVVYGATASLGFATLENVLYVMGGGWTVALARAFTAVPMHAFLGAILGYYVGRARFNPQAKASAWRGFLIATVLHGLYDFGLLTIMQMVVLGRFDETEPALDQLLLALGMLVLTLATLIITIVWARRIVHKVRGEQLAAVSLVPSE
jgi:RsiW-degrading membrane proteinase PrsW (M82 family)